MFPATFEDDGERQGRAVRRASSIINGRHRHRGVAQPPATIASAAGVKTPTAAVS